MPIRISFLGIPEVGEKQLAERKKRKSQRLQWPAMLATDTTDGASKKPGPNETITSFPTLIEKGRGYLPVHVLLNKSLFFSSP